MPRVVILGGGFAGFSAAREFERRARGEKDLEIVLVDRHNYMLFTPMLPEAASGSVEFRHITQPFRTQLRRVRFHLAEIVGVNETQRCVTTRHPITGLTNELPYDELVLALGSAASAMGVAGAKRFALPMRVLLDAYRLRNRVLGALEVATQSADGTERDRLLRFVIAGGGFTGVELAGELNAFLRALLRFYPALEERMIDTVLIERGTRLLPHLPARFGNDAARELKSRNVEIRLNAEIERVDFGAVVLKGGERYESRTIVWTAGTQPAPFVKRLQLATNAHDAVVTERDFSVPDHPHLWAIGDCAAIPMAGGGTYAPLAQNATREGPLLARNVLARLRGRPTRPFAYQTLGQMASLGDRYAIAQLPYGITLTGLPAWILWRAYYLGRLPGFSSKTRVVLDWTLGLAFGPPTSRVPLVERGDTALEHEITR